MVAINKKDTCGPSVQKITRFQDGTVFILEQTDDLVTETYYKTTAPQRLDPEPTPPAISTLFFDMTSKRRRHNLRFPALILIHLLYILAIGLWVTLPLQYEILSLNRTRSWDLACPSNVSQ
ncbi:hypothetical protein [Phascolarctid gammaherpesvirus 1]|uniref:Uncharacterized protein n=1 Tax=Phascolarctid gammaherpesvirus 1 TaxID=2249313 RepID=A0A3S5HA15_9GAMA|nr:hypothetical protein KM711_gp23 [Phascolarctid gammaherpesvirus 1]AZB49199.1 hypothetical protein [Phascolarctid gammaherpesvirus 1]